MEASDAHGLPAFGRATLRLGGPVLSWNPCLERWKCICMGNRRECPLKSYRGKKRSVFSHHVHGLLLQPLNAFT